MSTKKSNQEKALEKFVGYIGDNIKLCDAIKLHLENHHNVLPEYVHYGHVGNMVHVNELLTQIAEFLQIKVKE